MRNFSEEEFGRIFASQKPGFAGFRFAPFFALRAKNASRPCNPLRGPGAVFFGEVVRKLRFPNNSIVKADIDKLFGFVKVNLCHCMFLKLVYPPARRLQAGNK
jgi:hypothetical protein